MDNKPLVGTIRTTGKGMGFVDVEGYDEDIVITPEFLNTALNNDEVEVQITGKYFDVRKSPRGVQGGRTSVQEGASTQFAGQIVKIIKRAKKNFVGMLVHREGNFWVSVDDRKMYTSIMIPDVSLKNSPLLSQILREDVHGIFDPKNIRENLKVLAHITRWERNEQFPTGEITQVLGTKGDHETEMQSIIMDRGIDTTFPDDVMKEAEAIGHAQKKVSAEELAKRKDLRNTLTFTIDPVDAKDFDDAISYKELGNGKFEIGVHIADVSHFVREGTAIDAEAKKRAFSVYLVDRTIPMLPEVLSNDLCSLNPHEDKYAFSAVFTIDAEGKVYERWFGKSVINSNKRFTYELAQDSIDGKNSEYTKELRALNDIAKKLEKDNYNAGAIDFEQDEVKFKLDENGKPIAVYRKPHLETHKLVEEYMLLANKEVAEFIFKSYKGKSASLYRIHDLPDKDRIADLSLFIQALGYHLPVKQGKISSRDINTMLKSIEGKPEEALIKTATIRSMAKAVYSPNNIGHFGLGFDYYTHFTSPIRRYPDLIIHRILEDVLHDDRKQAKHDVATLSKIANSSTDREIAAAEAERASIKYKQVEYMAEHIGETFDGTISGVTEWGIYIEDKNTRCEGMVPLRELGNDFYVFNKKTYSVKGERTKQTYRLGDSVKFKVVKADLDAKTLDYKLVETK